MHSGLQKSTVLVLQDENRHGDFFTAILKARSEFVDSNDWQVGAVPACRKGT